MKALVIYNSNAGISTRQNVQKMVREKLDQLGYKIDWFNLDKFFEDNIKGHDFTGTNLVVAIGGDGTVKVATRTILENKLDAKLAIVPFGSMNVVSQSLGAPLNLKRAIKMIGNKNILSTDVGIINGSHYFIVGFSAGYISEIIAKTGTKLKNKIGFLGYVFIWIKNLQFKRKRFYIDNGTKKISIKGNSLIIFNAFNFYGFKPKIKISPSDGILNLVVMTNKNFWTMITAGLHFLIYREPRQYFYTSDSDKFKVKFKNNLTCQIDGDHVKLPSNLEINILPKAIRVIDYAKK